MAVELRALGRLWGVLSEDGRYLVVQRHDDRVACIDLVESARAGRSVLVRVRTTGPEEAEDTAAAAAQPAAAGLDF